MMRSLRMLSAAGLMLLTMAVPTRAEQSLAKDNAALWYWRCFQELAADKEKATRYIALLKGETEPANEQELAELREHWKRVVATAQTASRKPACDFAIEYEQGLDAALPHVSAFRTLAMILCAEAAAAIEEGDRDTAIARLSIAGRMVDHLRRDEVVISGLVSVGNATMMFEEVEKLAKDPTLEDGQRETLMEAVRATVAVGPELLPVMLEREREATSAWMLRHWRGPEDYQQAVDFFKKWADMDLRNVLHEEQLMPELRRYDAVMEGVVKAAHANDKDRLKELSEEAHKLKHGIIASIMIPVYWKTVDRLNELEARRKELLARLAEGSASAPAAAAPESDGKGREAVQE